MSQYTTWLVNGFRSYFSPPIRPDPAIIDTTRSGPYPLDENSALMTLPDGRKLCYALYGVRTGAKYDIFYMPGLPGSRLQAAHFDKVATRLQARIISVDRPGHGWSSPQPNRTLLDHPKDINHLADHLDITTYGVLGISGGGPYALACAKALLPSKLKAVSIAVGLGPPDCGNSQMRWLNWLGFTFGFPYMSWLVKIWFSFDATTQLRLTDEERLEIILQQAAGEKDPKDRAFFTNPEFMRVTAQSLRESFAQGQDGHAQDGKLMACDFGFRVQDIRSDLPVQLWYGKKDVYVPPNHGEVIAARLGSRARLRIEDETHASLFANWYGKILEDLVEALM